MAGEARRSPEDVFLLHLEPPRDLRERWLLSHAPSPAAGGGARRLSPRATQRDCASPFSGRRTGTLSLIISWCGSAQEVPRPLRPAASLSLHHGQSVGTRPAEALAQNSCCDRQRTDRANVHGAGSQGHLLPRAGGGTSFASSKRILFIF